MRPCGLQGNWISIEANLAVYFLVWHQVGSRRCSYRVCNRGDFSADSGTQCLRVYLLSFNTVSQGRPCFSLKLLTNIIEIALIKTFCVQKMQSDLKFLALKKYGFNRNTWFW